MPVVASRFFIPVTHSNADEALARDYIDTVRHLHSLVENGFHTIESLMTLYMEGIGAKDLDNEAYSKPFQHGTQSYFEERMNHVSSSVKAEEDPSQGFEKQFLNIVIKAIARLVSLGELKLEVQNMSFQTEIRA